MDLVPWDPVHGPGPWDLVPWDPWDLVPWDPWDLVPWVPWDLAHGRSGGAIIPLAKGGLISDLKAAAPAADLFDSIF